MSALSLLLFVVHQLSNFTKPKITFSLRFSFRLFFIKF